MKITEYLTEDLIITGIQPTGKQDLCGIFVDHLIEKGKISPDRRDILIEKLLEREALSSTGIGLGVAIPHASGENIENMLVVIGQIPRGVDYDSIDGEPVKLVFMIIGSERVPRVHLQLLATIVRACKNTDLVESLQKASTPRSMFELISEFDNA